MRMIGVTGTQGKTTTTRLLEAASSGPACAPAVIGTVGTRIDGRDVKTVAHHAGGTRPARPVRDDARARVDACAMEVSSHALVHGPGRRRGLRRRGLPQPRPRPPRLPRRRGGLLRGEGVAVHARAGPAGAGQRRRRARPPLAAEPASRSATFCRDAGADWRAVDVVAGPTGSHVPRARPRGRPCRARSPLPGAFNVSNALAALAACAEAGFDAGPVAAACAAAGSSRPDGADRRRPGLHGRRRLRPQAGRGRGRAQRLRPLPPAG